MSRIITLQKNDEEEYYTASFRYDFFLKEFIKYDCKGSYNPNNYTWSFNHKYLDTLKKYADQNHFELYFSDDKKIIIHFVTLKRNSYTLEIKTRNLLSYVLNVSFPTGQTYTKLEIKELIQNLQKEHNGYVFTISVKRIPLNLRFLKINYEIKNIVKYNQLYDFQKKTIDFMSERNFTGLIADEMGLGKTIQAITVSQAAKSEKNIVICPLNVRSVWEEKIKEWSNLNVKIQSIKNKKTKIDNDAHWYIINYDMLINIDKKFKLSDVTHKKIDKETKKKFKNLNNIYLKKEDRTKNTQYTVVQSGLADEKEISFIQTLDINLYKQILEANDYFIDDLTSKLIGLNPTTLILDEAHNIKNPEAKKSIQAMKIAEVCKYKILLTGTPFLNDESETNQLNRIILGDERYSQYINIFKNNPTKTILEMLMIRRKKQDIDIQLPEKTREWIDIPIQDSVKVKKVLLEYQNILNKIKQNHDVLNRDNITHDNSNNLMSLRRLAGEAKVYSGQVSLYIANIVENCGSCCAFLYHTAAINELKEQLLKNKYKVEIIDGQVNSEKRKEIIQQFQSGKLDILLLNGKSAKEGITLTRSYNFVFVEFDWAPGYMEQAEDRGHRIGQESEHYFIHYLYSSELEVDLIMRKILERKQKNQNEMMNDNVSFKYDDKRFILDLLKIDRDIITVYEPEKSVTVDVEVLTPNPNVDCITIEPKEIKEVDSNSDTITKVKNGKIFVTEKNFIDIKKYYLKKYEVLSDTITINELNSFITDSNDKETWGKCLTALRQKKKNENKNIVTVAMQKQTRNLLNEKAKQMNLTIDEYLNIVLGKAS
jgi:SNF2 family DNA or RNA helicase